MPLRNSPSELDSPSPPEGQGLKKIFTVEEANATLPLVQAIVSDLSELARSVVDRKQRISHLSAGRNLQDHAARENDLYSQELAQVERDLDQDTDKLNAYIVELRELGVEPKGAIEGLVDFPALHRGRIVFLCWKLSEPEILHWHEVDGGFSGRRPITSLE